MFENMMKNMMAKMLDRVSDMEQAKLLPMVNNFSLLMMEQIAQRAKTGEPLYEPEGTTRKNYIDFRDLVFIPAQMKKLPLERNVNVDTSVTIGPTCKRPLKLAMPLMLTGMGYGVSVSMEIKKAMALASRLTYTAVSSGEAGFIPEERELAHRYIVQYNRGHWGNSPEELQKADMIEVKVGQGAAGSDGFEIKPDEAGERLSKHLGMKAGETAVCPNRFPEIKTPSDWGGLVRRLRGESDGIPIAVKIGAGDIEGDIDIAVDAGFDAIVIDGGGGGTAYSLELTINNMCIPLAIAICRAHNHLVKRKVRDRISLIAAGGAHVPGDFLKVMALGADAVYVGQPLLVAMVYYQLEKMPVGTNPTQMFLYTGKETDKLNYEEAANHCANFLKASVQEMVHAARIMGKSALRDVSKDDMAALTEEIHKITGVRLAYGSGEMKNLR